MREFVRYSLGIEASDPNLDAALQVVLQQLPVRRRVHGIETFNVLRGGEYLFMPSISALKWFAELA